MRLRDVDRLSFGPDTVLSTIGGYSVIIINYVIFALPSTYDQPERYSSIIVTNALLAVGGGNTTVFPMEDYFILQTNFRYTGCRGAPAHRVPQPVPLQKSSKNDARSLSGLDFGNGRHRPLLSLGIYPTVIGFYDSVLFFLRNLIQHTLGRSV